MRDTATKPSEDAQAHVGSTALLGRKRLVQPILISNGGTPELWLCSLVDGAWKPILGTGPIQVPDGWKIALRSNNEAQRAAVGRVEAQS